MYRKLFGTSTIFLLALSTLLFQSAANGSAEGSPVRARIEQEDFWQLMTKGKLQADLGNYEIATEAFSSIAEDETAPKALRWEALVRLGLVRSAAGDARKGLEAFRTVQAKYSEEPEAVRFLTYAVARSVLGKNWIDFKAEFEELLRSAEIVSVEDSKMDGTGPKVVYLQRDEIELKAVWKPIPSHQAEVAVYELDKILALDMVPPAVERVIEDRPGSIQLWVKGCRVLQEVQGQAPTTKDWRNQLSRMKTFDNFIGNRDRNAFNVLVDPTWSIILIDHSLGFSNETELLDPPVRFDRQLVEKMRNLDPIGLQARLEGILAKNEIENVLKRRDALLALVEQLIEEKGEAQVLFR